MKVFSPDQPFPPQNRRLKLEVFASLTDDFVLRDVGKEMDYILIGRDWQEEFKLTFEAEGMIIEKGLS